MKIYHLINSVFFRLFLESYHILPIIGLFYYLDVVMGCYSLWVYIYLKIVSCFCKFIGIVLT